MQKCLLQSTVNDQMEETLSKGLTEATLKEHRMQWISAHICVLGGGYIEAICLLAEKKLPHSFIHPLYAFFSCGYGYLAIPKMRWGTISQDVFRFLTASSSKRFFVFHRSPLPLSTQSSSQTWPVK